MVKTHGEAVLRREYLGLGNKYPENAQVHIEQGNTNLNNKITFWVLMGLAENIQV